MTLLDIIASIGTQGGVETLPDSIKGKKDAVAETIENNVRSKIIRERLQDPAFYDKMSKLLDEIIAARKAGALAYKEYLTQIAVLVGNVRAGQEGDRPTAIKTVGQRALYSNLSKDADLAIKLDAAIKRARPADWRGVHARETGRQDRDLHGREGRGRDGAAFLHLLSLAGVLMETVLHLGSMSVDCESAWGPDADRRRNCLK